MQFVLHLQKTHLTGKVQTLSMPQKHLFKAPPPPASQHQVRMSNLKDFKYINPVLTKFLKLGVICIYCTYNMHANNMHIIYA